MIVYLPLLPPARPVPDLPVRRPSAPGRRRAARWARAEAGGLSTEIRRVQEYVEVRLGEVRTLDEMAEVAGWSRYHFARRFRDETGEPPWAYVRRKRAEHARRLLEGGRPPAEVAHEAGYADQAHLTRDLRDRLGRTPAEIRRAGPEADRKDVQDGGSLAA